MFKPNKKKGFTIVELVIVIAVVGVLTAVLVPTFVNLTNRAKEAENQTFVRNINTQLALEEADPSVGRYERVSDAIKSAQRMGFDVTKLTPVDGNDIVWDSAANRFAIVKPAYATNPIEENVVYSDGGIKATEIHKIWKMYRESEMPSFDKQTYSIYAKGEWNVSEVTVKTGFDDAGQGIKVTLQKKDPKEESTSSLLWSKAGDRLSKENEVGKTFVIENSSLGDIVIDYPEAKVIHYGDSGYQTFNALSQYDERGSYRTRDNKSANSIVSDAKATGTGINNILADGIQVTASKEHQTAFVLGEGVTGGFTVNGQEKASDVAIDGETSMDVTKVNSFEGLNSAIGQNAKYIILEQDISYPTNGSGLLNILSSMTIDGNGHSLSGYGKRGNYNTTLAINYGGAQMVDLKLVNLTINNSGSAGRPLETRGYLNSLNLSHVTIKATGSSGENNQAITIGGAQQNAAKIVIEKDSTIDAGASGYPIISFNPFETEINDSLLNGYCGIYFRNDTYGAQNCIVTANRATFNCPNSYSLEGRNSFGVFAIQQGVKNNRITLNDCKVNNKQNSTAYQTLVSFGDSGIHSGTMVTINGSESYINGSLSMNAVTAPDSKIVLNGGTFTVDPFSEEAEISGQIVELGDGKTCTQTDNFTWKVK